MRSIRTGLSLMAIAATSLMLPIAPAGAGGGGCHTGPTEGTGATVELVKACFTPSILRVDRDTEVTFVGKDPMSHNISASGWGTDTDMHVGDVFTARFVEEGIYPYACMYHFGMTGAIVVGDGKGAATIPVDVGTVEDALADLPATEEALPEASLDPVEPPVDPRSSTSEARGILGWAVPGALGLVIGGGAATILRSRRREDD